MPQPWSHLTIICQDVCWTKLTLNYSVWRSGIPQPVLSPPCHRSKGGNVVTDMTLTWFQLGRADKAEKIDSSCFRGSLAHWAAPKVDADGRIPSGSVCRNFKEERRHSRDGVNSLLKRWKCHEQDTASACAQEEDEPQKLHNFLISSLPETWLNSVVQRATLTSTFCMICKTDFL